MNIDKSFVLLISSDLLFLDKMLVQSQHKNTPILKFYIHVKQVTIKDKSGVEQALARPMWRLCWEVRRENKPGKSGKM